MDGSEQRAALAQLIERDDVSLATVSRVLGRNPAWAQQYLRRGTPKLLPEADRAKLARFFGVDETRLGGPRRDGLVAVRRFDLAASAGRGRLADGDRPSGLTGYPAEDLASMHVDAARVSTIEVDGESMAPTLCDGDRILVDHDARPGRDDGAIWVIRLGDELRVKRLRREREGWRILSDNPSWDDDVRALPEVEVIGRVIHLTRRL